MLLHFVRTAAPAERARALALLATPRDAKPAGEVDWLLSAMRERGSLEHGRRLAREYCERALALEPRAMAGAVEGDDRRFLREMISYVIERLK